MLVLHRLNEPAEKAAILLRFIARSLPLCLWLSHLLQDGLFILYVLNVFITSDLVFRDLLKCVLLTGQFMLHNANLAEISATYHS